MLAAGGDFLHCDVLDGHFAPNISFGPHVIEAARRATPAYLDCHLMISEPVRYADALVRAGANSLTFHVEAVADPVATAAELRKRGCRVGVTLRPATPVEAIWPVLDAVDLVLVMSVVPGFSGQAFMPEVLGKCEAVKAAAAARPAAGDRRRDQAGQHPPGGRRRRRLVRRRQRDLRQARPGRRRRRPPPRAGRDVTRRGRGRRRRAARVCNGLWGDAGRL